MQKKAVVQGNDIQVSLINDQKVKKEKKEGTWDRKVSWSNDYHFLVVFVCLVLIYTVMLTQ